MATIARFHEISEDKLWGQLNEEETRICLENVPPEYLNRREFLSFAFDTDQGRINKQSIREAMAAILIVDQGIYKGPLTRAARGSRADFNDAQGSPFDIKAFSSRRAPQGKDFDPAYAELKIREKWFDKHQSQRPGVNSLTGEAELIKIVVDLTWLSEKDRKLLKEHLGKVFSVEENKSIVYVQLPEPQEQFRAPNE